MRLTKQISYSFVVAALLGIFDTKMWAANESHEWLGDNASSLAFQRGEYLKYRLHYGIINAGTAELKVDEHIQNVNGRDTYHVIGTGRSRGAFDWFFKVRDRYESFIDTQTLTPWLFLRDVNEGGFKFKQRYEFKQGEQTVWTQKKVSHRVPESVQDMLSAFYFARTLDFTQREPGEVIAIPCFLDDEVWNLRVKYLGKETVRVDRGTFRCHKFVPVVQKGRIFKEEEDLLVYISDDENKIPVLLKASVLVGSIKMELQEYKGLGHTVAQVK